jgi:hypothetical protein
MNPKFQLLSDPSRSIQQFKSYNKCADNFGWLTRDSNALFYDSGVDTGVYALVNNLKATHCTYYIGNSSYKNWQGLSVNTKSTKSLIDCDYILGEWGLSEDIYTITPESFYLFLVKRLANVEIIVTDHTEESKHFITILNEKNQKTREHIYEIEIRMYEFFEAELDFSIYQLDNSRDVSNLIRDKTILYYKSPYNEY